MGKVWNEIVRFAKSGMICAMHQAKSTAIRESYPQKSYATVP
jgi:hypothetical protein